MKAASFDYHRPESVDGATRMLAELGEDAKILAGGQSLVPMLALRLAFFDHLVDISQLDELKGIERRGDDVWIGAATTDAVIGDDEQISSAVPLLTRATPFVGHFQIRSRGTLGGSIAHADPAGEYPAVALALGASVEAVSPGGRRTIPATEFFTGVWETALEPGEVLTGVRFPVWTGRRGFAVQEFARRHGDFAIAGTVVAVALDSHDRVSRCGIGLLGLGSTPRRASKAEAAVVGRSVADLTGDDIGELAMSDLDDIPSDLQGSASYRSRVGAVLVARAWAEAIEEATTEATNA